MALAHSIISINSNLVLTREIGKTTNARELLQTHQDILDHPQLGREVRFLVSLDSMVEGLITAEDMASCVPLQQKIMAKCGVCRIAMVAPDDLAFGLSRMFKSYMESTGHLYGIFDSLDESLAWLNVTEEEAAEIRRQLQEPPDTSPSSD